jgi:hypothetical protein
MDKRFSDSLRLQATLFEIPSLALTGDGIGGLRHRFPCLVISEEMKARKELSSIEGSRARANVNLSWLILPPVFHSGVPPRKLLDWLCQSRVDDKSCTSSIGLCVSGVEQYIFSAAVDLLPAYPAAPAQSIEQIAEDVESFESICQEYQSLVNQMVTVAVPGGPLVIELRSRATLVTWAIACLVERLVRRLHPQLEKYEMALCFTDLWLLSLSDGLTHSALASVCAYLRLRTSNGEMRRPVFSHLPGDETERLAEEVGRASLTIKAAWKTETGHADRRRDVHWAEVQRKQALAQQLQDRLKQEMAELSDAQTKVNPKSVTRYSAFLLY